MKRLFYLFLIMMNFAGAGNVMSIKRASSKRSKQRTKKRENGERS